MESEEINRTVEQIRTAVRNSIEGRYVGDRIAVFATAPLCMGLDCFMGKDKPESPAIFVSEFSDLNHLPFTHRKCEKVEVWHLTGVSDGGVNGEFCNWQYVGRMEWDIEDGNIVFRLEPDKPINYILITMVLNRHAED